MVELLHVDRGHGQMCSARDGHEPAREAVSRFAKHLLADGNLVAVHTHVATPQGDLATVDLFRARAV